MKIEDMENSHWENKRFYRMNINALIGYVVAEFAAVCMRILGLSTITYVQILFMSLVVNASCLAFILLLRGDRHFSRGAYRVFFSFQLVIYAVMYSMAVVYSNEFRMIVPVFALLAVSSLLPFATVRETAMVAALSILSQIVFTYYSISHLNQSGVLLREFFFTVSFCPALVVITFVARQINDQKRNIRRSKRLVDDMNQKLLQSNMELEHTGEITSNELELATQLQNSYLPEIPCGVCGWDLAVDYRPKYAVSGDFYDFYVKEKELEGLAIFDVSGHGVSSALLTMIVKPIAFRLFKHMEGETLSEILRRIDANVSNEISRLDNFITCIFLRFRDHFVEYVNAGHTDLILKRAKTGLAGIVEKPGRRFRGEPLGVNLYENTVKTIRFRMEPGDVLLLYTDCILESRSADGEAFGLDRLMSALEEAPAGPSAETLAFILDRFFAFISEVEMRDDLTVILVKKEACSVLEEGPRAG